LARKQKKPDSLEPETSAATKVAHNRHLEHHDRMTQDAGRMTHDASRVARPGEGDEKTIFG
jgi:hypothetical protein